MVAVTVIAAAQEPLSISPGPRFWGATVDIRYALNEPSIQFTETTLLAGLSAAYETSTYVRLGDGALVTVGTADSVPYPRFDGVWELGAEYGLLPSLVNYTDSLVVFALYRGQYDLPMGEDASLFTDSGLPESAGRLAGAVIAGAGVDTVVLDEVSRTREGVAAEASVEWGPSFLHNQLIGEANYGRLNLTARQFSPIFTLDADGTNRLSLYQATYAAVDWGFGAQLPYETRATFGGRSPRSGLGGAVRGYTSRRYDADFKAVFNTELRLTGPPLVVPFILPGLLVHYDAGFYSDTRGISPIKDERSGFVQSAGAGAYVEIVGVASIVFYTHALLSEPSLSGTRWVPFSLGFGFHM